MTYQSLTIESHPSRASAERPYQRERKPKRIGSLNAYSWPAPSSRFAKEQGLDIDYIDNCWSRVALDGAKLRKFLQLGVHVSPEAQELMDAVVDVDWYVINEEEF